MGEELKPFAFGRSIEHPEPILDWQPKVFWELLESEARERYFIDEAKEPAFLICSGIFTQIKRSTDKCTLYMNSVASLGSFPSFKKARKHLKQIVAKATKPIQLYREIERGKRVLFAEKLEEK